MDSDKEKLLNMLTMPASPGATIVPKEPIGMIYAADGMRFVNVVDTDGTFQRWCLGPLDADGCINP
jgi:hypothetical protein